MAKITSQRPERKEREYSPIGTFIVIALIVFCFIVVPIKLFADASGAAALAYLGLSAVLVAGLIFAFKVPVTQRERLEVKSRPPMDLDLEQYNPNKDGVSW